jgi:hypothetical protein
MKCKECGNKLPVRIKDLWSRKLLDSGLCLICFRINESEKDPETTKYLDMDNYKKKQRKSRRDNEWKKSKNVAVKK